MTWRERVVRARTRGRFTAPEKRAAGHSWLTCAVGEQHRQHPDVVIYLGLDGGPQDLNLFLLGGGGDGFATAVSQDDFGRADEILDQIEDRVLQLKRGA